MRAAWKQYDLTPTGEFYLIGYGDRFQSRREPARGIHDRIYGSALLWEAEAEEYLIFNADMIEFLADFCDDVRDKIEKQYGIKKDHILISATHNHQSVRDYHRTWPTGKYSAAYEDFLIQTIVHSAEDLRKELTEVRIFTGKTVVEGYYGSRLHAGQPADNEVILVEFRTKERMASRILGMGDILSLIEKAESQVDEEKAKELSQKLRKAEFDYNDFLDQMNQIKKMGGMSSIMNMMPGMGQMKDVEVDEKAMDRVEAIILSMTDKERTNPDLMKNASRKQRVARGAGVDISEVNRIVKQFDQMKKMMKQLPGMMGGGKKKGGLFGKFKMPF